jgi:hypothetical protein
VTPTGFAPVISSNDYSNISGTHFTELQKRGSSERLLLDKSRSESQDYDDPYDTYSNTPTYEHRSLQKPITDAGRVIRLHNTTIDTAKIFRREVEVETSGNENINTSWKQLMMNDTSAFIIWNVTNTHVGFNSKDEAVEKCLDEFNNRRRAIAPYLVSTTVRENGYFLRNFINKISKYSHLHDLRTVQDHYDEFKQILKDHQSYYATLKEVIQNMDQETKYTVYCAQRRFCTCFSQQDIVRYEEQFSFLSQYNFLLRTYLICGHYIDPIIRVIFIVTGLILNGTILIIFTRHKNRITECDVMVMNIAVNGILILIVYIPLQYIHFYYSSVIRHEEFSNNGFFVIVQTALISVSGISLLTLRAQHNFQVTKALNTTASWWPRSVFWQSALCVLSVWVLASSVAVFTYMFNNHPKIGHLIAPLVYIVLYILILSLVMNRIKLYAEKDLVPPEQENIINSRAIVELCKVFWITHFPLFLWLLLEGLCGFALRLVSINYSYVEIVFCYVYFSYTCVNTLALYRASCGFRKLLYTHLFRCRYKQEEVMMTEIKQPGPETQPPA